jgi:hypothetical protein
LIQASEVVQRINAALDAEDSDRYIFDLDHKPAINDAIVWMTTLFGSALETKKIGPENLRELIYSSIFQPNKYGRIAIDPNELNREVFYIVSVNPEARTYPEDPNWSVLYDDRSAYRDDLAFVDSDYSATNLTYEEWYNNKRNVFKQGNLELSDNSYFKSYAYLNFGNVDGGDYSQSTEIVVRPNPYHNEKEEDRFVGITYVKRPEPIKQATDTIPFPYSVIEMLYMRALHFISYKQGDGTNLHAVTERDIQTLSQLLS